MGINLRNFLRKTDDLTASGGRLSAVLRSGVLALVGLAGLSGFVYCTKAQNPQPVTLPLPQGPVATGTPPAGTAPAPVSDTIGGAVRQTLTAKSLNGAGLPYRIFVPATCTERNRCPALYLLHGWTGNEDDWWKMSHLPDYLANYRLIVVTPGVGDTWYANSATNPNARYEDVIVKDLIPDIDAHYPTVAKREARAIAGLSMGGLGAMKYALRYPQMFSFAGSFSGAFGVATTARLGKKPSPKLLGELEAVYGPAESQTRKDNDVIALLTQMPRGTTLPYLYVAVGSSDPLPQVSEPNPVFAAAMDARGLAHEYHLEPGTHDWKFWDSQVQFMFGRLAAKMPAVSAKH